MIIPNAFHELTPRLASQWPTQMSYEKSLKIQKECSWQYDFCGAVHYVSWGHSMFNIHCRAMKLCIRN